MTGPETEGDRVMENVIPHRSRNERGGGGEDSDDRDEDDMAVRGMEYCI